MSFTLLEDMSVYKKAILMSNEVWCLVSKWNNFEKNTIGNQVVRSADSVGANIAEGFGRFHYGEKIRFYYFARGSAFETQYWIKRSHERKILCYKDSIKFLFNIQDINKELNFLIKGCRSNKSQSQS